MLWFAQKLDCPLQLLTLAKGKCAETVIHLMRDERSINAVKVAIAFGNGLTTRGELDATYAANVAYAAAADVTTDSYVTAKKANQLKTANICREILTDFIKSKIL
jgi:hypothetical protein